MDVHNTLLSASNAHCKGQVAAVDSQGGYITPCSSTCARKIDLIVQSVIVSELGAVRLCLENGTYVGQQKIKQHVQMRDNQEPCSARARQQSGASQRPSKMNGMDAD